MAGKKVVCRPGADQRILEALESRRLLATLTWVGDVDANWGTSVSGNTNWSSNLLPQTGDTLVFSSGARPTSTNNRSNLSVAGVQVSGIGTGNLRYVIGGNQLTLTGSTAVTASAPNDGQGLGARLALPLKLAANTSIAVAGVATTLEVAGAVTGSFILNKSGPGTLVLSSTGNSFGNSSTPTVLGGTLRLGAANVYPDTVDVAVSPGATFDLNDFNERIGVLRPGAGTVDLGSGTLTVNVASRPGNFDGTITGTGGLTVEGGATQFLGGLAANSYTGTTNVKDGAVILFKPSGVTAVPGDLVIGASTGLSETATVGLDGDGGSDEQVADTSNLTINNTGAFYLASRTETIASLAGQAGAAMHLGFGTLTIGGERSTTFDGIIDDGGPGKAGTNGGNLLIKSGPGSLTLTRNNPFTATTRIRGGTLYVNGTQTASAVVLIGGTLGGSGSVATVVAANGGGVAPGGAPDATAVLRTRDVALDGRSSLSMDLNGVDPGVDNDQLNVQGTLSLANARLNVKVGFTPGVGLSFVLINNDGSDPVNGTFDALPQGAYFVVDGQTFRISYTGGTGNDVVLTRENGPAVLSASYDFTTAPRLVFAFTQDVHATLSTSDLLIRNLDTAALVDPGTFTLSYEASSQTATFTHAGGPLPDGNYRVTLDGAGVANAANVPIGAVTTLDFFAFAGDADRNRTVDFNDLVRLAQNYNGTGKSFPGGDFNYDGRADFQDLVLLAQRYNTSLPPPPISGVLPGAGVPAESESESVATLRSSKSVESLAKPIFSVARVRKPVAAKARVAARR